MTHLVNERSEEFKNKGNFQAVSMLCSKLRTIDELYGFFVSGIGRIHCAHKIRLIEL